MTQYVPYKVGEKHFLDVDTDDEVNYVGNVIKWLTDNNTSTSSFEALSEGCTVILKDVPQGTRGGLLPVRLKVDFEAIDPHITFRVSTEDEQQFDKTIWFNKVEN